MIIRLFESEDTEQIARLFHDTVRRINIRDYSEQQVVAWSPDDIYFRNWRAICSTRFTYVAEADEKIIGFGGLEANGHIDCFYVHYLYQGQGVGSKIYHAIELKARKLNLNHLFTEASITAKTFFIARGFTVIKQQEVVCRGEKFVNYLMQKAIVSRTLYKIAQI